MPEADSGWYLLIPLAIAGAGLGQQVSQLNNYTLAPIDEERISEAAGVNSASAAAEPKSSSCGERGSSATRTC